MGSGRGVFFQRPAGFVGWLSPYAALGVSERDPQAAIRTAIGAYRPTEPERAASWDLLSSPVGRLAWHVVSANAPRPVVSPAPQLERAMVLLHEVLRRELAGEADRAENLWPYVRQAIAAATKAPATGKALAAMAAGLGLDDLAGPSKQVLDALDRELLPGMHSTMFCASALGKRAGRDNLHEHWMEKTASGKSASTRELVRPPPVLWQGALGLLRGLPAKSASTVLAVAVQSIRGMDAGDRAWVRGNVAAMGDAIANKTDALGVREALRDLDVLDEACALAPSVRLLDVVAAAHYRVARRLMSDDGGVRAPMHLARAAALSPGHPEPVAELEALAGVEGRDDRALAIDEARAFLRSDATAYFARTREEVAVLDIAAALTLSPFPEHLPIVVAGLAARHSGGDGAFRQVVTGATTTARIDFVLKAWQGIDATASASALASVLPMAPFWEGLLPFGRELSGSFERARNASGSKPSGASLDGVIARAWLRSSRDWPLKLIAVAGVVAIAASAVRLGVEKHRAAEAEAAITRMDAAAGAGDRPAVRVAAARFLEESTPDDDRRPRATDAWRSAIAESLRDTPTQQSKDLEDLAMDMRHLTAATEVR